MILHLSDHPHSAAFTVTVKGTIFVAAGMLAAMAMLWSLAFLTIGPLGTQHLWSYFGLRGVELVIAAALGIVLASYAVEWARFNPARLPMTGKVRG